MEEVEAITKKRNAVLKRIQEQQRMMELIKNKNVSNTRKPLDLFSKIKAVKRIQKAYRDHLRRIEMKKQLEIEKSNAKFKFNATLQGMNLDTILVIIKVQRAFRNFLFKRNRMRKKDLYLAKLRNEFYKEISLERGVELRKEVQERLSTMKPPDPNDYEQLVNIYYNSYKNFCLAFPDEENIREDNFLLYYQSLEMLKYLDKVKQHGREGNEFREFMLNKNKAYQVKTIVDKYEEHYKVNNKWYEDEYIDDFEESNLLDEIDSRYHYKKRSLILNGV